MEIYKRKVGYEDFNYRVANTSLPITASSYLITATTLYFPFMLTQDVKDIGIYTDTENPVYEIVDFSGVWDLSNTGLNQNPCLILNNCNVSFTAIPITYYNANNGLISALITGCPGPQTVQWSGPNGFTSTSPTTPATLTSGSYTIKVTDANCNITYANYFLTQPQSLSFSLDSNSSQTNATSPGGCNGTASIVVQGGQPPYTYLWYSGNTSNVLPGTNFTTTGVTGLCAGTYSVQITDSATPPTMVSGFFVITEPSPISGSVVTTTNTSCFGGNNGSITLLAQGGVHPTGYTYVLSGPTSATLGSTGIVTFNNLVAGTYSCTIYDSVGNLTTLSPITLTSPTAVITSISSTNTLISTSNYVIGCFGSTNGNITITPSGGASPYDIFVNGNSLITPSSVIYTNIYNSTSTINNLGPGTYTITNSDSNGCNAPTQTIILKQRPRLDIVRTSPTTDFNGYNLPCFGSNTGVTFQTSYFSDATTTTPVGSNPIAYYLNGVFQGPTITGLVTNKTITMSAGTHTITAVNTVTNCSATTIVTLTQPPSALSFVGTPNIDIISGVDGCTPSCITAGYGGPCCQAIINVTGGVGPYTVTWLMDGSVSWGTGIVSDQFCSTNPYTTLQVTVVDSNGCTITSSISV